MMLDVGFDPIAYRDAGIGFFALAALGMVLRYMTVRRKASKQEPAPATQCTITLATLQEMRSERQREFAEIREALRRIEVACKLLIDRTT